jgi:hypothetical protein
MPRCRLATENSGAEPKRLSDVQRRGAARRSPAGPGIAPLGDPAEHLGLEPLRLE